MKLVRLLRKGGMGSVWTAEHTALRTEVAVKFIAAGSSHSPALVARFSREATYTAQIKSPHVVQVHDHGVTADGQPFIVMELLEGEDLDERLRRLGPLPTQEVAQILGQLCKVVGKAHQLGIIHRDIKLSNVFLLDADGDGDVFTKLLDFGVAKQHGDKGPQITAGGDVVGTLVYMSPEQLNDAREVDNRSDLWSLGVVVYRMLTGELPFRRDGGVAQLLLAVNAGQFTPATALRADLPRAVDAWFQKALTRDPGARFTSAREMSEAFDLAVGWESTNVRSWRTGAALAQQMAAARRVDVHREVAPTLVDPVEIDLASFGSALAGAAASASPAASAPGGSPAALASGPLEAGPEVAPAAGSAPAAAADAVATPVPRAARAAMEQTEAASARAATPSGDGATSASTKGRPANVAPVSAWLAKAATAEMDPVEVTPVSASASSEELVSLSKVESNSNTAVVHLEALSDAEAGSGSGGWSLLRVGAAGLALGVAGMLAVALLRGRPAGPADAGPASGVPLGVEPGAVGAPAVVQERGEPGENTPAEMKPEKAPGEAKPGGDAPEVVPAPASAGAPPADGAAPGTTPTASGASPAASPGATPQGAATPLPGARPPASPPQGSRPPSGAAPSGNKSTWKNSRKASTF
ncbi:serine/threonine protein kinase PksC [Chondromyces apiculatus DSM 436]|uniref:Serine/threonine protein kinase PksC n=1 Tax=Chondromyces apiculatus DSM 436 TaxID=1192034 RepID=A0A017TG32_9BACT|nr:serine/threonine protein kinase PksC [Chondromyces apiculatus DSM 436]